MAGNEKQSTANIQLIFNELMTAMKNKVPQDIQQESTQIIKSFDSALEMGANKNRSLVSNAVPELLHKLLLLSRTPDLTANEKQALVNFMKPLLNIFETVLNQQYKQGEELKKQVSNFKEKVTALENEVTPSSPNQP